MSRRDQIRMTDEEQAAFLETSHTAILTSIGKDGLPHPVAMWYVTIDGEPWFATYGKSQKVMNYRRNPAAAVLIEDGRSYSELRGLLIQGQAEVVDDPARAAQVQAGLYFKYNAPPGTPVAPLDALPEPVQDAIRKQAAKRSAVVIHADRIATWDHRKLGGVYCSS